MKIALSLLALPAAFGLKKRSPAIRKLNDAQNDYDGEVDEYEFLQKYEQVYMTCDADMSIKNEEGDYEYGVVIARMCPNGATCDNDGKRKCKDGYGDYAVGIQTYMEQFLEQFERNQEDENEDQRRLNEEEEAFEFNFGEFGECSEFEVQNNNRRLNEEEEEVKYYVGPKCDEGDIRIALFSDEDCKYESSATFEELVGISMPWSESIIDDADCRPYYCSSTNENGEQEYNDFCTQIVEQASFKCEERMENYSIYGKTVAGCETISAMLPSSGAGGPAVFLIVVLVASVVGFGAWYFMQQKKRSAVSQQGLAM